MLAKPQVLLRRNSSILKDWPLLERAVDVKIEQQREFVGWWDDNLRGVGNPEKKGAKLMNAERRLLTCDNAEALTGITQQQVSKWRRWQ